MSDLVNRLRGKYQVGPDGVFGTRSFADFIPPISLEAADRIEQLEKALDELTDIAAECDSWESFPSGPLEKAIDVLRA